MRLLLLLYTVACLCINASAQKLYYNAQGNKCPRKRANSFVVFKNDDSGYRGWQYSLDHELMMSGRFEEIPADLNKAREGNFIYYYPNGNMARAGRFGNSGRTGTWLRYAYANGRLNGEDQYVNDTLQGPAAEYNYKTGEKQLEGLHEHGLREGPWKFYISKRLTAEWMYSTGKVVQVRYFDEGGHTIKVMSYRDERLTAAHAFDADGREYPYRPSPADSAISYYAEQRPSPPYDMSKFLTSHVRYPEGSMRQQTEGSVVVRFLVDEQGRISNAYVLKSIAADLDAEALRVVALMPRWAPGLRNGDPVKMWCVLPVIFRLQP